LSGSVGEGLIDAFLCENARHFIKDLAGSGGALDLGEGSGQFINAGDAPSVGLLGGLALSFLPPVGLLRIGEGGLSSAVITAKLFKPVAGYACILARCLDIRCAEIQPDSSDLHSNIRHPACRI
jgi:hypothetical protein